MRSIKSNRKSLIVLSFSHKKHGIKRFKFETIEFPIKQYEIGDDDDGFDDAGLIDQRPRKFFSYLVCVCVCEYQCL